MRLGEIMTAEVVSIGPDEAANTAWSRMDREGIRHLVVTEGKRLLGVLSERDLGGSHGRAVRRGRAVRDLMTPQVAVASPATTLRQAANLMRGQLIGCLPVVDDGRVVGIATATDVLGELGRGSSRPAVRAKRQAMRLPLPARGQRSARAPGGASPKPPSERGRAGKLRTSLVPTCPLQLRDASHPRSGASACASRTAASVHR
jgi:acetoin utilization protein AcuB